MTRLQRRTLEAGKADAAGAKKASPTMTVAKLCDSAYPLEYGPGAFRGWSGLAPTGILEVQ